MKPNKQDRRNQRKREKGAVYEHCNLRWYRGKDKGSVADKRDRQHVLVSF